MAEGIADWCRSLGDLGRDQGGTVSEENDLPSCDCGWMRRGDVQMITSALGGTEMVP